MRVDTDLMHWIMRSSPLPTAHAAPRPVPLAPLAGGAQTAQDLTLRAPDGTEVTIDRGGYGAPHLTGSTGRAVFFGQAVVVAR